MKKFRWLLIFCLFLLTTGGAAIYLGNDVLIHFESKEPSQSIGTPAEGSLVHGKRLPTSGPNFHAFSRLAALLGRNSVNDKVRDAVVDAYAAMAKSEPERAFIYGETSWPRGGRFRPHKSHQNGLSVDFMVPVLDEKGKPAKLPIQPWNKFGYGIEFDSSGRADGLSIDFVTIARHLLALKNSATARGLNIRVVIFDPPLQTLLFKTTHGAELRSTIRFSTKPSWVRHDEHYHVDFEITVP